MIRTVLIDDETDSIRVLQKLLETYCPQVEVVGTAEGVETGLAVIQATRPDLLFLDIEMTQGNAFDLLNQLRPLTFQVIFVTAFDNYAIRAFKYSAVDYLLKPVDIDELVSAVSRVAERSQQRNIVDQMQVFLDNMGTLQPGAAEDGGTDGGWTDLYQSQGGRTVGSQEQLHADQPGKRGGGDGYADDQGL